jgi:hypothetical protein
MSALRDGDTGGALDALLTVWQQTRSPEVADFIDRLSPRAGVSAEEALAVDAAGTVWMELARRHDPRDLGPLLSRWSVGTPEEVGNRFGPLVRFADDPRTAAAFASAIVEVVHEDESPFGAAMSPDLVRRLASHLIALRDERTLPVLAQAARRAKTVAEAEEQRSRPAATSPATPTARRELASILADAAAQLSRVLADSPPLPVRRDWLASVSAELPSRIVAREPPPSEPKRRQAWQLVRSVHDAPEDDDVRRVCGDALFEIGDPRAELIALGFKVASGKARATDRRRIDELVKAHGTTWLGRLAARVSLEDVTFEKGFIGGLRIHAMPVRWWREIADAPELATVRRLELTGRPELFEAIATSPSLARLSELAFDSTAYLEVLTTCLQRTAPVFSNLSTFGYGSHTITRNEVSTIRSAFPRLSRLSLAWRDRNSRDALSPTELSDMRELIELFGHGLTELTLESSIRIPGFVVNVLTLLGRMPSTLERLDLNVGPEGWSLTRARSADGTIMPSWIATLLARSPNFDPARIRAVIAALPDDVPLVREIALPTKKRRQ